MASGLVLGRKLEDFAGPRRRLTDISRWIGAQGRRLRAGPFPFQLNERMRRDIGMTQAEADWALLQHRCSGRDIIDPPGTDPLRALANRPPA